MHIYRLTAIAVLLSPVVASAQSAFGTPDGTRVSGAVIECATNIPTVAAPCGIPSAPLKIDQGAALSVPPAGGSGVVGFLAGIYSAISSGLTVAGSVSISNFPTVQSISGTVITNDGGTAITSSAMPAGGIGATGWLSAIWSKLSNNLSVSVTNFPTTQAVSGTVTATPTTAAVSDCSTTLAVAGASYQLVAQGTSRKSILMQNLGATSAGFSLTSVSPVIGGLGTFTLLPNASVQLAPGFITSNALYAVGSVALQPLACTLFQ